MQRSLLLWIVGASAFLLAACGSGGGSQTADGDSDAESATSEDGDTDSDADSELWSCNGACQGPADNVCYGGFKLCVCNDSHVYEQRNCMDYCELKGGELLRCDVGASGAKECLCSGLEDGDGESEADSEISEAPLEDGDYESYDTDVDFVSEEPSISDDSDTATYTPIDGVTAICHTSAQWAGDSPAFRDATSDWGLADIGAKGIRVSAVDFDNDGWPDLAVRLSGSVGNDFHSGGKRVSWLLRNNGDGTFKDVTESSGICQPRVGTDPKLGRGGEVWAFGDVNNDGYLDVFIGRATASTDSDSNYETSEILLNNGDGTFRLGPADSAVRHLPSSPEAPSGAAFVDFDRDGNLDLWVPQYLVNNDYAPAHLYKGDGTGNFTDVTAAYGALTKAWNDINDINHGLAHPLAWSAAACDLNNDGNPELLAGSYGRAPNLLLQGGLDTQHVFSNRSVASGYAYDNRIDWSDNQSARCWCKWHPNDVGCHEVPHADSDINITCASDAGAFRWSNDYDRDYFRLGGNSAATICADINNDGWLDLVTSEIVHWDVGSSSDPSELLLNLHTANVSFWRPGNALTGLARQHDANSSWDEGIMSGVVFDFDNDGLPDIYWGNSDYPGARGLLYHQTTSGHFEAVSETLGIDHRRSHGAAVADFNRDGKLDLVVGHSFMRCSDNECYPTQQVRLFENTTSDDTNFVSMTLIGANGTNRAAIGARLTVLTEDGQKLTREIGGGYGHYGAENDLTVHIGLGNTCQAKVTIRWPDATLSTDHWLLPAGHHYLIAQGGKPVADDKDAPVHCGATCQTEGLACGTDACGRACGTCSSGVCSAGQCVACLQNSDCPTPENPCQAAFCSGNQCQTSAVPDSTSLPDLQVGDCLKNVCVVGMMQSIPDDSDTPTDTQSCMMSACNAGVPTVTGPRPRGTSCSENFGRVCNGAGACVECLESAECLYGSCIDGGCVTP